MAGKKGSSLFFLLGVFIAGGLFFLAAYGVYVYLENNGTSLVDLAQQNTEQVETVAEEIVEEEGDKTNEMEFVLPNADRPQVITGEAETTYRFSTENSITVAPSQQESVLIDALGRTTEESVTVAGVQAERFTGSSAKDGSTVNALVVPMGTEQVLFVRGTEAFLDEVEAELYFKDAE